LGWYNPFESELDKSLNINEARVRHWLSVGAEISERASALVAKVAPQIMAEQTAKVVAHKAKSTAKKKARKKAAA
jgi:small subunit ribosomal protein S16